MFRRELAEAWGAKQEMVKLKEAILEIHYG